MPDAARRVISSSSNESNVEKFGTRINQQQNASLFLDRRGVQPHTTSTNNHHRCPPFVFVRVISFVSSFVQVLFIVKLYSRAPCSILPRYAVCTYPHPLPTNSLVVTTLLDIIPSVFVQRTRRSAVTLKGPTRDARRAPTSPEAFRSFSYAYEQCLDDGYKKTRTPI